MRARRVFSSSQTQNERPIHVAVTTIQCCRRANRAKLVGCSDCTLGASSFAFLHKSLGVCAVVCDAQPAHCLTSFWRRSARHIWLARGLDCCRLCCSLHETHVTPPWLLTVTGARRLDGCDSLSRCLHTRFWQPIMPVSGWGMRRCVPVFFKKRHARCLFSLDTLRIAPARRGRPLQGIVRRHK